MSLRVARLIWTVFHDWAQSARTVAHYRELYAPTSEGWQATRQALQRIVEVCREHGIPCYVVLFPMLYHLGDTYPFADIHRLVRTAAEASAAHVVDLLPRIRGRDERTLWVHPTDHHPNETVHAIAAQAIVDALIADHVV